MVFEFQSVYGSLGNHRSPSSKNVGGGGPEGLVKNKTAPTVTPIRAAPISIFLFRRCLLSNRTISAFLASSIGSKRSTFIGWVARVEVLLGTCRGGIEVSEVRVGLKQK